MSYDRRLTPARDDLAAEVLRGQIDAPRYAAGVTYRVQAPVLGLRPRPDGKAALDTELLHGEVFEVFEVADGWAWGQSATDDYVGYVDAAGLGEGPVPNAWIGARSAQLYRTPTLKSPPVTTLPWGAGLALTGRTEGAYAETDTGLWCDTRQIGLAADDPVEVAEAWIGAPYLWGGRSVWGLDCSALVQLAYWAVGRALPRDSDMQEAALQGVPGGLEGDLRRGDLVFWRGHVGMLSDRETLLHANAYHMQVVSEPLSAAVARIAASDTGPVTSVARVPLT